MNTESVSARLDRICVRLDQIQNQNVDVLEMKTQIQSANTRQLELIKDMLAGQTEKQAALENSTSQIVKTLQQEKTFMRDQLSQAQQEILGHLTEIQTKMGDDVNSSMMAQTNKMLNQLTESINVYSEGVMDIGAKMTEQDGKLNQLKADILNITESSCIKERCLGRAEPVDNTKLVEHMEQMALKIDTFMSEVGDTHAQFKGMTKAEFVWLENMIDKKLAEMLNKVGTNLQVTEEMNMTVEQMLASLNNLHDKVTPLNKSSMLENEQTKKEIDKLFESITESYSSLNENLHSVSDKLHYSVVETLGKYEEISNKQLQELTSQNDSINILKKQIEDLRQQNVDFKVVVELETKKTDEIMMKHFNELKENIDSVSSVTNQHFRDRLPKECKVVSDRIYTEIIDATHILSNLIMKVQTEILQQSKDNAVAINEEMCDVKESSSQIVSNISKIQENMEAIRNQVKNVGTIVNKIDKNIETVVSKGDKSVETIVNEVEKNAKNVVNSVERTAENILSKM